ncbi:MAG TPA: haloacid dehalogenase-like hydrolase [Longimicrobium sp.]|nr:haloacid dehalogenase-like hydrolase [Longimicrobium sp.]
MPTCQSNRRIVVADWDYTLCGGGFTAERWTEHLFSAGLFADLAIVRSLLMEFRRGSLEYEQLCTRFAERYARGLRGCHHKEIEAAAAVFVGLDRHNLYRFLQPLLRWFERANLAVFVITGAPSEPMRSYARTVGFHLAASLSLKLNPAGYYTGEILENSGLRDEKKRVVSGLRKDTEIVAALGDSISDLPLLDAARVGFVVSGAGHTAVPLHPRLITLDPKDNPDIILSTVEQSLTEAESWPGS